jgi:hypothetical protein
MAERSRPVDPVVGRSILALVPVERVAILSIHSHGDRSFLDDSDLARLSGDLRQQNIASELVWVALRDGEHDPAIADLTRVLGEYDVVVFERVWSAALITRLRRALGGTTFVQLRGEHELEGAQADWVLTREPRRDLPALLAFLRGDRPRPPPGSRERLADGFRTHDAPSLERPRALLDRPDLHPRIVNPEAFAHERSFAIRGNGGCPYQADARDNPLYAGVEMPAGVGRGCAFCTTGNHYDGRPAAETAAHVLDQLRWVRSEAPEIRRIVLKDQNPFAYLTEVVQEAATAHLGPFTLMLETRADWLLRSRKRFERALQVAEASDIRLVPFLVGIESFSQPELDRYNKGTTAEANVEFVEWLWALRERFGKALALEEASFGFVLFSPWTTMDDLEANYRAIVRTRFDRLRGRLLHSRARLYPDTALYYLAERDGLFTEAFASGQDNALRYGYFPARPWRHRDPTVAHFSRLATELVDESGGKDEVRLFGALLDAFRRTDDPTTITIEMLRAERARPPADPELWSRFARLVRPLALDAELPGGWTVARLERTDGGIRLELRHATEKPFELQVALRRGPRPTGTPLSRSKHYDVLARGSLDAVQQRAAELLSAAIADNDR